MTELGKKNVGFENQWKEPEVVFYDFENILSYDELVIKTQNRLNELIEQGFTKQDSFVIIFEDTYFMNCFVNRKFYNDLKKNLTYPNTQCK
jgi:hypothetical protein